MKDFDSTLQFWTCVILFCLSLFLSFRSYNERQEINLYKKVTSIKIEKMDSNTFAVMYPTNNYATKETYFLDSTGEFRRFVVE